MYFLTTGEIKWITRSCCQRFLRIKLRTAVLYLFILSILVYLIKHALRDFIYSETNPKPIQFSAPSWHDSDLLLKLPNTCYIPKTEKYVLNQTELSYKILPRETFTDSFIRSELIHNSSLTSLPLLRITIKRTQVNCAAHGFRIGSTGNGRLQVYPTTKILETAVDFETQIPTSYEYFRVQCQDVRGYVLFEKYHTVVRSNERAAQALEHWTNTALNEGNGTRRELPADILLIGIDSLSRSVLRNRMPNLFNYLQTESQFLEMKGFLSQGSSARSSMFPFVAAGASIPRDAVLEHNRPMKLGDYAPILTMKALEELRYVTFYGEDIHWRLSKVRGLSSPFLFSVNTTYNIDEVVAATKISSDMGFFQGDSVTYLLNYTAELLETFDRKAPVGALLWFKGVDGHQHLATKTLALLDDQLVPFLRHVTKRKEKRILVILFGNRGYWNVGTSSYEEITDKRLPALYMSVPRLTVTMLYNSDRIVAPLDIWTTVRAIASGINGTMPPSYPRKRKHSHLMTFDLTNQVIPPQRGCEQAGVRSSLCPCSKSATFSPQDSYMTSYFLALQAVHKMNADLARSHNLGPCQEHKLLQVTDRILYKWADNPHVYKILFTTNLSPNNSYFAAIVSFDIENKLAQFPCRYDWLERIPGPEPSNGGCLRQKEISIGCHYPTRDARMGVGMLAYLQSICYCKSTK